MPRYNRSSAYARQGFGTALREARSKLGLSQVDLAEAVGLSQAAVSKWESGEKEPERQHVFECERVCGLMPGELASLLGYGPPIRAPKPQAVVSIRRAIMSDDKLSKAGKDALLATYRALTTTSVNPAAVDLHISQKRCIAPQAA